MFHDSHLPICKWFMAIALLVDANKSMSALQLSRHLGVNYRTAIADLLKRPRLIRTLT
jgi:hypothetical protein